MRIKFGEVVGAIAFGVALLGLTYLAITTHDLVVIGALISLTASGSGYFLRAKVQPPT
jgi:hypothetical protein